MSYLYSRWENRHIVLLERNSAEARKVMVWAICKEVLIEKVERSGSVEIFMLAREGIVLHCKEEGQLGAVMPYVMVSFCQWDSNCVEIGMLWTAWDLKLFVLPL